MVYGVGKHFVCGACRKEFSLDQYMRLPRWGGTTALCDNPVHLPENLFEAAADESVVANLQAFAVKAAEELPLRQQFIQKLKTELGEIGSDIEVQFLGGNSKPLIDFLSFQAKGAWDANNEDLSRRAQSLTGSRLKLNAKEAELRGADPSLPESEMQIRLEATDEHSAYLRALTEATEGSLGDTLMMFNVVDSALLDKVEMRRHYRNPILTSLRQRLELIALLDKKGDGVTTEEARARIVGIIRTLSKKDTGPYTEKTMLATLGDANAADFMQLKESVNRLLDRVQRLEQDAEGSAPEALVRARSELAKAQSTLVTFFNFHTGRITGEPIHLTLERLRDLLENPYAEDKALVVSAEELATRAISNSLLPISMRYPDATVLQSLTGASSEPLRVSPLLRAYLMLTNDEEPLPEEVLKRLSQTIASGERKESAGEYEKLVPYTQQWVDFLLNLVPEGEASGVGSLRSLSRAILMSNPVLLPGRRVGQQTHDGYRALTEESIRQTANGRKALSAKAFFQDESEVGYTAIQRDKIWRCTARLSGDENAFSAFCLAEKGDMIHDMLTTETEAVGEAATGRQAPYSGDLPAAWRRMDQALTLSAFAHLPGKTIFGSSVQAMAERVVERGIDMKNAEEKDRRPLGLQDIGRIDEDAHPPFVFLMALETAINTRAEKVSDARAHVKLTSTSAYETYVTALGRLHQASRPSPLGGQVKLYTPPEGDPLRVVVREVRSDSAVVEIIGTGQVVEVALPLILPAVQPLLLTIDATKKTQAELAFTWSERIKQDPKELAELSLGAFKTMTGSYDAATTDPLMKDFEEIAGPKRMGGSVCDLFVLWDGQEGSSCAQSPSPSALAGAADQSAGARLTPSLASALPDPGSNAQYLAARLQDVQVGLRRLFWLPLAGIDAKGVTASLKKEHTALIKGLKSGQKKGMKLWRAFVKMVKGGGTPPEPMTRPTFGKPLTFDKAWEWGKQTAAILSKGERWEGKWVLNPFLLYWGYYSGWNPATLRWQILEEWGIEPPTEDADLAYERYMGGQTRELVQAKSLVSLYNRIVDVFFIGIDPSKPVSLKITNRINAFLAKVRTGKFARLFGSPGVDLLTTQTGQTGIVEQGKGRYSVSGKNLSSIQWFSMLYALQEFTHTRQYLDDTKLAYSIKGLRLNGNTLFAIEEPTIILTELILKGPGREALNLSKYLPELTTMLYEQKQSPGPSVSNLKKYIGTLHPKRGKVAAREDKELCALWSKAGGDLWQAVFASSLWEETPCQWLSFDRTACFVSTGFLPHMDVLTLRPIPRTRNNLSISTAGAEKLFAASVEYSAPAAGAARSAPLRAAATAVATGAAAAAGVHSSSDAAPGADSVAQRAVDRVSELARTEAGKKQLLELFGDELMAGLVGILGGSQAVEGGGGSVKTSGAS